MGKVGSHPSRDFPGERACDKHLRCKATGIQGAVGHWSAGTCGPVCPVLVIKNLTPKRHISSSLKSCLVIVVSVTGVHDIAHSKSTGCAISQ